MYQWKYVKIVHGRVIYTPLKSLYKPEISFGAEIRSPQLDKKGEKSNDSTSDGELTEVEYPK